jgi:hypothetical protein
LIAAIGDGCLVFVFGVGAALFLFRDSRPYPMSGRRVTLRDHVGLALRFALASAQEAGSFQVKLREVGPGIQVGRVEFDGALEFLADLSGQSRCRYEG